MSKGAGTPAGAWRCATRPAGQSSPRLPLLPPQRTCDREGGSEATGLFICSFSPWASGFTLIRILVPSGWSFLLHLHLPCTACPFRIVYGWSLSARFAIRFLYLVDANVCVVAQEPETPLTQRGSGSTVRLISVNTSRPLLSPRIHWSHGSGGKHECE